MSEPEPGTAPPRACSPEFWDALARHHKLIEDNYLDLRSVRLLLDSMQAPVLVVGAGQGLIVAELRNHGFHCDGIDSSPEMIRYASLRRGVTLVQADAKALPFAPGAYKAIVYATGVVDFLGDEQEIRTILNEGRRITNDAGKMFVAFYRLSEAQERFVKRVGLLANHVLLHRQSLEVYLLSMREMVRWVASRARVSPPRAIALLLGLTARCRWREIRMTSRMQRICREPGTARALLNAAPLSQPYRNATEIEGLFQRLGLPIKRLRLSPSCFIVEL